MNCDEVRYDRAKKSQIAAFYCIYSVGLTALDLFPAIITLPVLRLGYQSDPGQGLVAWAVLVPAVALLLMELGLCPQIKHNCGGGGERNSHVHVAVTRETFAARLPVGLCFPSH